MHMQAFEDRVRGCYEAITKKLIEKGLTITTMESCTGGQIASLLTDTEGASAVLKGAYVTYSNAAKCMQGVSAKVIERFGVYSAETAAAMAKACRSSYGAHIGIGITGTFGNPDPNNPDSIAGRVWFAIDMDGTCHTYGLRLPVQSSRFAYKLAAAEAVAQALDSLLERGNG